MRCKKHISDRSSSVGVCATCLRERLFALIAAQALANETSSHRKSDATTHPHPPPPPPLIFPRSVSPYICRRSDDSSWNQHNHNDRRFYSTPQIGPTSTFLADSTITGRSNNKKKKPSKFSLFSNLFKSTTTKSNEEFEPSDPRTSTVSRASLSTSTSSPVSSTWFSSIISGRRKKQSRLFSHDDSISIPPPPTTTNRRRPCRDRGMSPSYEEEQEDAGDDGSPPSASGYSSESSNRKTQTTPAHPTRRKGHHHHQSSQHSRNVSSLAFCLSPLVRASPHRNQKDIPPGGIGVSGEIGGGGGGGGGRVSSSSSNKPHLSTAASFCANRSRKLANFGRSYNYNP